MQVILYTLPTCPVCNMIKTKLNAKNIPFVEEEFDKITDTLNTDRAPVLEVDGAFLQSPSEMVSWINLQE